MTTIWTSTPAVSVASINELRGAVDAAFEAYRDPAVSWTDGATLPGTTTIKAKHLTELRDAIQELWDKDDRNLGLIPNWTTGVEPGEPNPITPLPIQDSDITDLRGWFNHYETWGDLRGVHWWASTSTDFPKVGWNVETVYGVSNADGEYDRITVNATRDRCAEARNYGLVNIVRIDWKGGNPIPTNPDDYDGWKSSFKQAVSALKGVATIFIVGNEPNLEPEAGDNHGITSTQYANAFNCLYGDSNKATDVMYLAAGPAPFAPSDPVVGAGEIDTDWLENASDEITGLDGWALHTYGSPWFRYAYDYELDRNCLLWCTDPTKDCSLSCGNHPGLVGDASFRRYRDQIKKIKTKWAKKPVYLTETNTTGFVADQQTNKGKPSTSYITGWNQKTYLEVRNYNSETNTSRDYWPRVMCLCWFVDSDRNSDWVEYSLTKGATDGDTYPKLRQARADFIASDTSTGLGESTRGEIGPDPERERKERPIGNNALCGTIA